MFVKNLGNLIKVSLNCSKDHYEKGSPEYYLERYSNLYEQFNKINKFTAEILQGHKRGFREFYESNLDKILSDKSEWILETKAIFTPYKVDGSKSKRSIDLTYFYKRALDMKKELQKKVEKENVDLDKEENQEKYEAINFSERMILYIYRIFKEVATDTDHIKIINKYISEISEELGLSTSDPVGNGIGDGIGSIVNTFSSMLKQNGIETPGNINGNQMGSIIENIVNNKATKEMLTGLMSSINNSKDIGEALGNVATQIQRPEILKHISTIGDDVSKAVNNNSNSDPESDDDEIPVV